MLTTSATGKEAIKEYEGVRLRAYLDTGGVVTIGVGHTSPGLTLGMVVSMAQVDKWLDEDLQEAEEAVNRLVTVPLTQNQFDSLVSFTFNLGEGQFSKSTLLKKLNAGDYDGAQNEFKRWVYDNGKIQPGLVKRRHAEAEYFGK